MDNFFKRRKKGKRKRGCSLLLSAVMVFNMLSFDGITVSAAEEQETVIESVEASAEGSDTQLPKTDAEETAKEDQTEKETTKEETVSEGTTGEKTVREETTEEATTKEASTEETETQEEITEEKQDNAATEDTSLCAHHREHTADCGYSEEDNAPCGYECRLCPVEELIAALPWAVTEENAEEVRAQLEEILALYTELTDEEQERLDISRCLELQEALELRARQRSAKTPALIMEGVSYRDCDADGKNWVEKTCAEYTEMSAEISADITTWKAGWYVVKGEVTISSRVTAEGDVRLILTDGCILKPEKGITVKRGNSLTIYAQSVEGGMGSLEVTAPDQKCAGIGGGKEEAGGEITINGGKVTANGGGEAAGIGGGWWRNGGKITINGGKVTAGGGENGAGIGGGGGGAGGTITINGGEVTAGGGKYGAGIGGGGGGGAGGTITINGGEVTAGGGERGAGIGGGSRGAGETITITGGTITATGKEGGADIGGGNNGSEGTVFISGATVNGQRYYAVSFVVPDIPEIKTPPVQGIPEGGKATDPDIEISGYTILGWFENEADTNPFDFATETITKDLTLYAKLEVCTDFIAEVTIDGQSKEYTIIGAAWDALSGKTGTMKVLKDVTTTDTLTVGSGMDVTVEMADGATFTNTSSDCFQVKGGTLTLTGGTVVEEASGKSVVYAASGTLRITGGAYRSTQGNGLWIDKDAKVRLSGGTISASNTALRYGSPRTLKEMLDTEGNQCVVFCDDTDNPVTDILETQESTKGKTYTVKKVHNYEWVNKGTQHCQRCSNCGQERDYGEHTFQNGVCTLCKAKCTHNFQPVHKQGTTVHEQKCSLCRFVQGEPKPCRYEWASGSNKAVCTDCGSCLTITLDGANGLIYDGAEKKPGVTVTLDDGNALKQGYTVTYADNVNAGDNTASVTVEGNAFEGTYTQNFSIGKAEGTLTVPYTSFKKTFGDKDFSIKECSTNGDGKISYASDKKAVVTVSEDGTVQVKGAGTANITVSLEEGENYTGAAGKDIIITVEKAAPKVTAPTAADRIYNPVRSLADADLLGGTAEGVDGKGLKGVWSWKSADIIPNVGSSSYEAVFTPEDAANYKTATLTIPVTVTKARPYIAALPAASAITYGDALDASILSDGAAQYGNGAGGTGSEAGSSEPVKGTFAWKEPSAKPAVSDSGKTEYAVVFTPEDAVNYAPVEAAVTLTVDKAENAPNMPGSGMNVSGSIEKVGDIALPEGWEWEQTDQDTVLEAGATVSAAAVYTGADRGNYKRETVTITITVTNSSCDHASGDNVLYTGEGEKEPTCTEDGLGHKECTKGTPLLNSAKVAGLAKSYPYQEGKEILAGLEEDLGKLAVNIGKTPLIKDTDYTVRIENADAVGTGTVVLEATQTGAYAGEKRILFTITGTDLKKGSVTGLEKSYPYTGEPVEPQIRVYSGKKGTGTQIPSDAYTVRYSNYINPGKAAVTVTGIPEKGYTGSITASYAIGKYDISVGKTDGSITVKMPEDIKYAKGGAKPQPVITYTNNGTVHTLREGVDYTLKYSNNTSVNGKNKPTLKITGVGNYCGTVTEQYSIARQDLGNMTITVADKAYNSKKKGSYYYSAPSVYDLDGKQLKQKTDYTVQYFDASTGQEIGKNDAIANGTRIRVTVTAAENSSYTGTLSTTYYVREAKEVRDIAKVKSDKIAPCQYTGSEIKPEVSLYTQTGKTKNYLTTEDYEVIGYYNNVKKGKATILIRGINGYSGVKSIIFQITAVDNGTIWNGGSNVT